MEFEGEGARRFVYLGRARVDDFGSHPPPYVPLKAAVQMTHAKSGPQKKARAEYAALEAAREAQARAAAEEGKTFHVRKLEARVAELEARLAGQSD